MEKQLECEGCNFSFRINSKVVSKERYIQCPHCGLISENPLYEPDGR